MAAAEVTATTFYVALSPFDKIIYDVSTRCAHPPTLVQYMPPNFNSGLSPRPESFEPTAIGTPPKPDRCYRAGHTAAPTASSRLGVKIRDPRPFSSALLVLAPAPPGLPSVLPTPGRARLLQRRR